jgi:hypothetical protein
MDTDGYRTIIPLNNTYLNVTLPPFSMSLHTEDGDSIALLTQMAVVLNVDKEILR